MDDNHTISKTAHFTTNFTSIHSFCHPSFFTITSIPYCNIYKIIEVIQYWLVFAIFWK